MSTSAFIGHWSARYRTEELTDLERRLMTTVHVVIKDRGWITKDELLEIGRWNSACVVSRLSQNDANDVVEISRLAFETSPHLRHQILKLLSGVGTPIASAVLTVWDPQQHTLTDFRVTEALRRLGRLDEKQAPYPLVSERVHALALEAGATLRDTDRALWKWSKHAYPPQQPRAATRAVDPVALERPASRELQTNGAGVAGTPRRNLRSRYSP